MTFTTVLLAATCAAALTTSGCGTTVGSRTNGAASDARREVQAALARAGSVDARVDLRVEVAVDGDLEAEIVTTGIVVRGGDEFDLEIMGPAASGLSSVQDQPVQVRLVGGRLLQRGPVVADLIPEAGERWVDLGNDSSDTAALGLIGPGGFAALGLLDDLGDVSSTAPQRYEGSLREVALEGGRIVGVEQARFELEVAGGTVSSLVVIMQSGNGVELSVRLTMTDIGAPATIVAPAESDVYTP